MVWSHLNTCFLDVCSYIRTRPHTTRMCCCSFGMSDKIRHAYFRCDIMDNQTFVPFINLCLRWQILWWKWYTLSWCCLTLVATGYDSFFSKFSLNSLISLSLSLPPCRIAIHFVPHQLYYGYRSVLSWHVTHLLKKSINYCRSCYVTHYGP